LVGGTAIALYLGHRRSIDFDLFIDKSFKIERIRKLLLTRGYKVEKTLFVDEDQLDLIIGNVKVTFFFYPYKVEPSYDFNKIISLPSLLDLASMKSFTLGRRAKWKDYVDLYFILKDHLSCKQVIENAAILFGEMFNAKIFREQISYFEDIDYSEKIDFLPGFEVDHDTIKEFLVTQATEKF
jgi:hypothetical protein